MSKKFILFILLLIPVLAFSQIRPDEVIVNYSAFNKTLPLVLKELTKISAQSIVYSETMLNTTKNVNISVKNEKLGDLLKVILLDFRMSYELVGNQIVLIDLKTYENKKDVRIYGYLMDKNSGESLIGANIFIPSLSIGTSTNQNGFFSLKIKPQTTRINFSYLSYSTSFLEKYFDKDSLYNIYLKPDGLLNEIVINSNLNNEQTENTSSKQTLSVDKILSSNHLVGEPDLFRYINTLPGVTTAADGVGGLSVRGGSADQNLVLLDGVPVYNTGHALGIFSTFNSSAIKNASFYKGGFPARYNGRLSSIIDVHTKDGNFNKFASDINLSTIALRATVEGPIINDKSSFIVSYRRTFMDIWIKELSKYQNQDKNREGSANYFFNDFNAKLNFKLGQKNRLFLTTFHSKDQFNNQSNSINSKDFFDRNDQKISWGNSLYSLRWASQLTNAVFSNLTVYSTSYNFLSYENKLFNRFLDNPTSDTLVSLRASIFESEIRENAIKQSIDWSINRNNSLKAGLSFLSRKIKPRIINADEKGFANPQDVTFENIQNLSQAEESAVSELSAFIEDEINLGEGISLNLGVNYTTLIAGDKTFLPSLQPRFSFLAQSDLVYFRLGASRMTQFLHLLTNNGLGLPTDIWLQASPGKLPAQQSWILNSAFGYKDTKGNKGSIDVYFKILENMSSFSEGENQSNNNRDWVNTIPIGKGFAYGLEASVEKTLGNTTWAFNYTYSQSQRTFLALNNGREFPFNYNRNHSLKASFIFKISMFSEFLFNWSILSGNYYSQPINSTIIVNGVPQLIYLEKNNASFPTYHRLDVGFAFYNVYPWGRTKFFLGLYNAYNQNNPFYTEFERSKNQIGSFEFKQYSLLPILPTISYGISF